MVNLENLIVHNRATNDLVFWIQGETGALKNRGTNMCVGAGADIYAGKYVQQYECDDVSEFKFVMGKKL